MENKSYNLVIDSNSKKLHSLTTFDEDVNPAEITSAIPLSKDSLAVCERCGFFGLHSRFYKHDKFCSLQCSLSSRRKHNSHKFVMMGSTEHMAGMVPLEPLPQIEAPWPANLNDLQALPMKHQPLQVANSYEWKDELFGCDFLAAPVSLFKHAPLNDMWDSTFVGMKVEVRNTDCDNPEKMSDFFWVATVIKVKGYMGLLRYEGFGTDDARDFWVNLCCSEVHPVGWCATRGKPLIPPHTIEDKYSDWKKYLVKQLTGARTLPANFYNKLAESLKSRFSYGNVMEVVDKNRISQVKVASVHEIVGKRLHVKYYDSSPEDNGFWCHEDSPLIHPVGWAFQVGHPLDAPESYCERVAAGRFSPQDTVPDMFFKHADSEPPLFREGLKLEAIDPLNLSSICAATVMQVLNEGYMMIRIDCYPPEATGADWFCYHQRSPYIFPVGFCAANKLPLRVPNGWSAETFSWEKYLAACGGVAAPASCFRRRGGGSAGGHGFVAGMRLECADLMDPRLVCVATVARVVADLLKVHFDGWGEEYDQWLWVWSSDVYPVGWCRAVGHRLEGPLQPPAPRPPRPKRQPRYAKRRRKAPATEAKVRPGSQTSHHTEDNSQNSDTGDNKSLTTTEPSPLSNNSVMENTMDCSDNAVDVNIQNNKVLDSCDKGMDECTDDKHAEDEISTAVMPDEPHQEENVDEFEPSNEVALDEPPEKGEDEEDFEVSNDCPEDESNSNTLQEEANSKVIPRLVNNFVTPETFSLIEPENWTTSDVAKFLITNDCAPYCENFKKVSGAMMLQLTKDEIIELLEMKVGPSLKIYDLIQQLKSKIKPQNRLKSSFK